MNQSRYDIAGARADGRSLLIDDASGPDLVTNLGTRWECISDRVMGGVSDAAVRKDIVAGRRCVRLSGDVRLENNGGFIQMALDLYSDGSSMDARRFAGIRIVVHGNAELYGLHLRTAELVRPWQSYRTAFRAMPRWHELRLPFEDFVPHRTDRPLNLATVRRLAVIAIGRAFVADLGLAEIAFYT